MQLVEGFYKWEGKYSGTNHYDAIDYEVPMTLSLYYYNSAKDIDNCFNWAPTDDQWWITGFTGQNPDYLKPKLDRMVMVSSVNLSGHKEMYEALQNKDKNMSEKTKEEKKLDLVFDDSTYTVWINWSKGVSDVQTTQ